MRENISKLFLEEKKNIDNESQQKKEEEKQDTTKTMKEIELKTEKKVVVALEKGKVDEVSLQSILLDGAKEFKEKTGRNMSYSEMREMFG